MSEDALLRAIADRPDDDLPRLVYADWLDEHGQPDRAEFIRVQCRLALFPTEHHDWTGLNDRERALLSAHAGSWLTDEWPGSDPTAVRFERGFVAELSFQPDRLDDEAVAGLVTRPAFGLVRELVLRGSKLTGQVVRALAERPAPSRLEFVCLSETGVRFADLKPLAGFRDLVQLVSLGGLAPVQGFGRVGPHEFYFRSRYYDTWTFQLSENHGLDVCDVNATDDDRFYREGGDEKGPCVEGDYMPYSEAHRIIRECGREYRAIRGLV
jgi:uncharacterized protein (TIGR02996 family)